MVNPFKTKLQIMYFNLYNYHCFKFSGNSDIGYKLIPYHVVTLNSCAIISFTLFQTVFLRIYNTSTVFLYLNAIPFLYNVKTKYYRVHFKWSDIIIAVNSLILIYNFILYENYYGVSLYLSYLFGYFVIGETGCIFDTELPSIDAFQYLICFLNYFTVTALCY